MEDCDRAFLCLGARQISILEFFRVFLEEEGTAHNLTTSMRLIQEWCPECSGFLVPTLTDGTWSQMYHLKTSMFPLRPGRQPSSRDMNEFTESPYPMVGYWKSAPRAAQTCESTLNIDSQPLFYHPHCNHFLLGLPHYTSPWISSEDQCDTYHRKETLGSFLLIIFSIALYVFIIIFVLYVDRAVGS